MTLWQIRAGSPGENEQQFFEQERLGGAWIGLEVDRSSLADRKALIPFMERRFNDEKPKGFVSRSLQVWILGRERALYEWVVRPSEGQ